MLATIGSAIGLFAATNIDDIVVLTVLFLASSRGKPRPWQIVAGQYLGFITLVVISVIAALGLTIVPDEWVGFLGLIPLGIGIKLPAGYEAHVVPRSSTFKNFGIIQTNHCGVIDNAYCGDRTQWVPVRPGTL